MAQGGRVQVSFHSPLSAASLHTSCSCNVWLYNLSSSQGTQHLTVCLQIVNSRFAANSASRGGAIYSSGASVAIMNSQFGGNTARTTGGAMYIAEGSALTVLNTTFSNNMAGIAAQSPSSCCPTAPLIPACSTHAPLLQHARLQHHLNGRNTCPLQQPISSSSIMNQVRQDFRQQVAGTLNASSSSLGACALANCLAGRTERTEIERSEADIPSATVSGTSCSRRTSYIRVY